MKFLSPVFRLFLYFVLGFALAVAAGLSLDARAATATQTYVALWGNCNGAVPYIYSSPQSVVPPCQAALRAAGYANAVLCAVVYSSPGNYTSTIDYTGSSGCGGAGKEPISAQCPNGGTYGGTNGTQYPGYCVVNGQAPPPPSKGGPDPACQAEMATNKRGPSAIFTPAGQTPVVDTIQPDGTIPSTGSGQCAIEAAGIPLVTDKTGSWWYGWFTGDVYDGVVSPPGSPASSGAAECASSGATQVCQSGPPNGGGNPVPGSPAMQVSVGNSDVQLPGSVPDDSCVTTASGAALCTVGAIQPNNGQSPPAPAAPDVVIGTAAPSTGTTVTPGPSFNVYGPGTIAISTNFGNGAKNNGSTTTTTTTCSGGTCTTTTSATTSTNAATYPTPVFAAGTSPSTSIAGAANAIAGSPLVTSAAGAIAQSVPAGSCPTWTWTSTLFNRTFDFSNGPTGVCTLSASYASTLMAVFAAMWVILGAIIILSA